MEKRSEAGAEAHALLRDVIDKFMNFDYISPDDVPDIPLYMDQVTTFMDQKLAGCKRYPDDKILTKTMINNYTKNRLIPPPEKKKYSKEHLMLLIFVYYFKDFLSIGDIKTILGPMIENHFQNEDGLSVSGIYETIFTIVRGQGEYITKDIVRRFMTAKETFPETENDSPAEARDREYLNMLSFICLLSFDIYVKKKMIEEIVDDMNSRAAAEAETRDREKEKAAEEKRRREEAEKKAKKTQDKS